MPSPPDTPECVATPGDRFLASDSKTSTLRLDETPSLTLLDGSDSGSIKDKTLPDGHIPVLESLEADRHASEALERKITTLSVLADRLAPPNSYEPMSTLSSFRSILIVAVCACTCIAQSSGFMVLNIAIPTIQEELHVGETNLQWLASSYALANGCLLMLCGRMADVYGRRRVYLIGLIWYIIWNIAGGFMRNGTGLIVSRALAGAGVAMILPSSIGIIGSSFTGRARSLAFAIFGAGAPVGGALGLVIGGLLTAHTKTTWRSCLWTMAGMGAFVFPVAYFVIPRDRVYMTDGHLDWPGAVLVTSGLICLQVGISDGPEAPHGYATSYIIVLLIMGPALLLAFVLWERRVTARKTRPPLMRLELWTRARGRLAAVFVIGCFNWAGLPTWFYHATLFYQQVQHTGPMGAMLRILPSSISGILCNVFVGWAIVRIRSQILISFGILCAVAASIMMANAPIDGSFWAIPFNASWIVVAGADFVAATAMTFVSALSLEDEQSVSGAMFQTLIQLGAAFGLSISSVAASALSKQAADKGLDSIIATNRGIQGAFYVGAGLNGVAFLVAVFALTGMGVIGNGVKPQKIRDEEHSNEHSRSKGGSCSQAAS